MVLLATPRSTRRVTSRRFVAADAIVSPRSELIGRPSKSLLGSPTASRRMGEPVSRHAA